MVFVFEAESGSLRFQVLAHPGGVLSLDWSPRGKCSRRRTGWLCAPLRHAWQPARSAARPRSLGGAGVLVAKRRNARNLVREDRLHLDRVRSARLEDRRAPRPGNGAGLEPAQHGAGYRLLWGRSAVPCCSSIHDPSFPLARVADLVGLEPNGCGDRLRHATVQRSLLAAGYRTRLRNIGVSLQTKSAYLGSRRKTPCHRR